MKRMTVIALTMALAGGLGMPRRVEAGQKEWATAGKILTGLVAAHVISDVATQGSDTHASRVVSSPAFRSSRTIVTRHYGVTHRRTGRYDYRSTPRRRRHGPVYRRGHSGSYRNRRSCRKRGPIIINKGHGQRLYQPRIRGHRAVLQVWSSMERRWVDVRECRSIW